MRRGQRNTLSGLFALTLSLLLVSTSLGYAQTGAGHQHPDLPPPVTVTAAERAATLSVVDDARAREFVALAAAEPDVRPDGPENRYGLAGGCYAVRALNASGRYVARSGDTFTATADAAQGAEPFHFQAIDLGRYLLFGSAADFLASAAGETAGLLGDGRAVTAATDPSQRAEWEVEEAGDGFLLRLPSLRLTLTAAPDGELRLADGRVTDETAQFGFQRVDGCAIYPEVEINVAGEPRRGETSYEEVRGFVDAHLHMMAFEFLGGRARCGRPWHQYGAPYALVDCPDHEVADGAGAVLENFLRHGAPTGTHDPVGWPTFQDWPAHDSLTHEQVYYRWLERAWRGGLRIFVNLLVDNAVLCEIYPLKKNPCDEMESVYRQAQRMRELQRYIDAQSGGPGMGWFRIVKDPFEAREIMNQGKLAVVLGIEVSELFGCTLFLQQPQCDISQVERQLDEVFDLGVRQMELLNKFDNALAGVAGDAGALGLLVNSGQFYRSAHYWDMQTCQYEDEHVHDKNQETLPVIAEQDAIFGAILQLFGDVGVSTPVYPQTPHCNTRGLSQLGAQTIQRMADKGMIFDPDHMSVIAARESLDLIEQIGYSGVVSSHSWATPDAYRRIYPLGGVITPMAGGSQGFVDKWRQHKEWVVDDFYFGFGYGSDTNGFATQGGPRGADADNPVTYPFEGFGGTIIDRQVSGERVYDINVDGVAHYGLYPDWIEDLRRLAGDEIVEDLERGPEAYLQMWERAVGVTTGCPTREELAALTDGMTTRDVLEAVGQPVSRQGTMFTYCLSPSGQATLTFDVAGHLIGRDLGTPASDPTPLPTTGGGLALFGMLALAAARRRRPRLAQATGPNAP